VTCSPDTRACFGHDGLDLEWTDTVFGDAASDEMRSRAYQERFQPQVAPPEIDGVDPVPPEPFIIPQPQQE